MTTIAPQRYLGLEGSYNTRDIGGYPIEGGGWTQWKRFLRSDGMHRLTDDDQARLGAYGVRAVIDLRMPLETVETPNVFAGIERDRLPPLRHHRGLSRTHHAGRGSDRHSGSQDRQVIHDVAGPQAGPVRGSAWEAGRPGLRARRIPLRGRQGQDRRHQRPPPGTCRSVPGRDPGRLHADIDIPLQAVPYGRRQALFEKPVLSASEYEDIGTAPGDGMARTLAHLDENVRGNRGLRARHRSDRRTDRVPARDADRVRTA